MSTDLFSMGADVEQQEEKDTLGGFKVWDSGLYPMTVKTAFLDDYKGGSKNITVVLEDADGNTYTEQECVWSANTKGPFYIDKKTGKKKALIGFSKMDSLAKLLTGKSLNQSDYETKVHELYSAEAKAKVPTPRPTLVEWAGKTVYVGILKKQENKQVKGGIVDGKQQYVATAEIRETNEISKWFDENKCTLLEKEAGKPATFADDWEKANAGKVIDKTDKSIKAGPVGAAGGATAAPLEFS